MKYNWEEMTETQKIKAIKQEVELDTHNGTTKEDLVNMVKYMFEQFEIQTQ